MLVNYSQIQNKSLTGCPNSQTSRPVFFVLSPFRLLVLVSLNFCHPFKKSLFSTNNNDDGSFCSAWMNSLGATSGQDGVPLVEGDPGLLGAGGSEKRLDPFAQRAARSVIVLHCLVLDLLAEANTKSGYSTALTTTLIQTRYQYVFIKSWSLILMDSDIQHVGQSAFHISV